MALASTIASAIRVVHSESLLFRRDWPVQAFVRSTTVTLSHTGSRATDRSSARLLDLLSPRTSSNRVRCSGVNLASTYGASVPSSRFAAVTSTTRNKPSESTIRCRLRPFPFFPSSPPTPSASRWRLSTARPPAQVVVGGGPLGQVGRQHGPLAAGLVPIEHGVQLQSQIDRPRVATAFGRGRKRRLRVRQVRRVSLGHRSPFRGGNGPNSTRTHHFRNRPLPG